MRALLIMLALAGCGVKGDPTPPAQSAQEEPRP